MKWIFVRSISLVTVWGMGTQGLLRAAECVPDAPDGFVAPFTMVTMRNYGIHQFTGYEQGFYTAQNFFGATVSSVTYSGGGTELFSDKQDDCATFLCTQPFDANQGLVVGVSVTRTKLHIIGSSPSYTGTLTLWNNSKITFPLTCDATTGILYGTIGNDTHVAITTGTPVAPPPPPPR